MNDEERLVTYARKIIQRLRAEQVRVETKAGLSQMLLEEGHGSFPGELRVLLVVAASGVVVEPVVALRIHVHGVIHLGGLQDRFVFPP